MKIDYGPVEASNSKHRELIDAKNQFSENFLNELSMRKIKKKENFVKSRLNIQLASQEEDFADASDLVDYINDLQNGW